MLVVFLKALNIIRRANFAQTLADKVRIIGIKFNTQPVPPQLLRYHKGRSRSGKGIKDCIAGDR